VTGTTTAFTATEQSLAAATTGIRALIAQTAWKFAMADLLITNNYASVVDLAFNTGDAHSNNSEELRKLMILMTCYARFLGKLKASGHLSKTTVAMFSEFDRSANLGVDTSFDNRGTEHNQTSSVLLAGYGVKRGKVIGDRMYGGSRDAAPLNLAEGYVRANYAHVFPTFMKIFGVEIPANQITDASPVLQVVEGYGQTT
jgi:uncharacterized protein (DUF1501 family)